MAIITYKAAPKASEFEAEIKALIEATKKDIDAADEQIVSTDIEDKVIVAYQTAANNLGVTARKIVHEVVTDEEGNETDQTRLIFKAVPRMRLNEKRAPRKPKTEVAPTAK